MLEDQYQEYLAERMSKRESAREAAENMMKGVSSDDYAELYTRLLLLTDIAQVIADFARGIADRCFPDPPPKGKKK